MTTPEARDRQAATTEQDEYGRKAALPSTARMGLSRGRVEILQFFRDRTAVIFSFFFPALLLGPVVQGMTDRLF